MCGISGIIDLTGRGIDRDAVIALRDSLAHRGPDDVGEYIDQHAGLGQRRLSIIDLSPAGRQPMPNEDGTVQVMCNGEIYNFRALKSQLMDSGHRFSSGSDCETLAHGYEQWGMEGLLARVKGMFSIAVWDRDKRTLWLARDRLGVKPLYFKIRDGKLAFASEPHGLYDDIDMGPDSLDRESLDYYLSFGYVPPDRAIVSGIEKMPPGHVLRYDAHGAKSWRYWDVNPGATSSRMSFKDQVDTVDKLLKAAVVRRLESDVPLGSFLSAGIDSGLVSAMAADSLDEPLRTFTVGFDGDSAGVDERPLARMVSERYGTDHHELFLSTEDTIPLPQLIWNAGEPFADVSVLPSHQISRMARNDITVALTGDGGDESFGGYANVYAAYFGSKVKRWVPTSIRNNMEKLISGSIRDVSAPSPVHRLGTLLKFAEKSPIELYDLPEWWNSELRSDLYALERRTTNASDSPLRIVEQTLASAQNLDDVTQILYTDLHLRLPGDYLTKIDIASNAVALEIRSPFLDHDLVEFAASLPIDSRMRGWKQKGMLRSLATRYLPKESLNRKKTGFGPPLASWLRGKWAPLVQQLVTDGIANRAEWFDRSTIRRTVDEHMSGRINHASRLWSLVCLEVWWRLFIDKTMKPTDQL